MSKIVRSFGHAGRGIKYALQGTNFKVQVTCAIVALLLGYFLHIDRTQFLVVILAIGLVLSMEATNTAVEEICNKFHPETHPHIALIKDLAAGAVLISAIIALIVGLIVFLPYL